MRNETASIASRSNRRSEVVRPSQELGKPQAVYNQYQHYDQNADTISLVTGFCRTPSARKVKALAYTL